MSVHIFTSRSVRVVHSIFIFQTVRSIHPYETAHVRSHSTTAHWQKAETSSMTSTLR